MPRFKSPNVLKSRIFWFVFSTIFISSLFGFLAGAFSGSFFYLEVRDYLSELNIDLPQADSALNAEYVPQTTQEESIISAVKENSPAVVSIIITKNIPVMERYYYNPFENFEEFFGQDFQLQVPQYRQNGTEEKEIGGGTGFIVSEDGMILTNKHVVTDEEANYTVFTNDGKKHPAKVLARDPFQDLAVIKIEPAKVVDESGQFIIQSFPKVKLGDSETLQIGQTVVAIGNALGEFRNTVSAGVVSGLKRTITASGGGLSETLEDVIQTDAAINKGNSGGPLLNLRGEVIGINTAMVQEAQSIGFAIPINKAKKDLEQIKKIGKIVYPFLGVRYVLINEQIQEKNNLDVNYGALIDNGLEGEEAVVKGSAAENAGLKIKDIILEINGEKITVDNPLTPLIQKYNPGDKINLKILRGGKEEVVPVTLGEKS
ncbi:MAG: trypsin-like peptidase domain-containing protein [Candidatus Pacebacteria bacterium]|nr:trypsin-like peptidase domain-containing protein [Candidatus Paceibacterota bacterium]